MANLKLAKNEEELKSMRIADIKKSYLDIGEKYNQMIDGDLLKCPKCGDIMKAETAFYLDKNYATERYPICKRCLIMMVEQRNKKIDEPNETKESVQKVLQMMDRVYDDGFYEDCVKGAYDEAKEKNRTSPFATYITAIQSLPNWKGKTWANSDFGDSESSISDEEINENSRILKTARKRFGKEFSPSDLVWLENNYQDWCARTAVDSLSQETYVKQICLQLLDIDKDRKAGKDVAKKIDSLDKMMNSANLQPKQNISNAATDALTFSQLIAKWELEKPIPVPDPELCDVSDIGKKIRVWFGGWLANAIGLNIPQSQEYLEEVNKYTVNKPTYEDNKSNSEIYAKLYGATE